MAAFDLIPLGAHASSRDRPQPMPRPIRGVFSIGVARAMLCTLGVAVFGARADAGDILRGGATSASTSAAANPASVAPTVTAPVNLVAGDLLRRTSAAL